MKPKIRRCGGREAGCRGDHGGPWMLFTNRSDEFAGYATWAEALAACRSWYAERAA